ncbi:Helix-turn-helix domain-containing protein [Ruminococcus sp. YE71]|uniref:helix-turn-helix transcriptional regulator n=1 Tax=unclassified Ruminococcus TaxID=2608920 RepID=UPI00088BAFCA|nr:MULTISPECIES: AraC family transcriptional regulator [unclassified Ruminococcus]SDA13880.1 Helix-turn-helix domain-containing protein [Ruminococcus sp. YE78]SFW20024.1 Helix-turn-helix domain-containing protein [Ruminococcus sp. YE71]
MIRLNALGMDTQHSADFCIDRPEGSGDRLLIIFKTDALLTLNGSEQPVRPDSAVIFDRGEPQFYRPSGGRYINHFLHFDTDDESELEGVSFGRLLTPDTIAEAETLMRMLSREQLSRSEKRERYISRLIEMLLLKLSEPPVDRREERMIHHSAVLNELRAQMYSSPAQFGSVASLAERVNLSPSHFQQLYRMQFGISCYEDLLTARIRTAQYYLSSTSLTVGEIARLCGYANTACFLHRFKDRTGMTPSGYRRSGARRVDENST